MSLDSILNRLFVGLLPSGASRDGQKTGHQHMIKWWAIFILGLGVLGIYPAAFAQPDQGMSIYTLEEPPASFTGQDGKPTGFAVDMVNAIGKRLGHPDPVRILPWARAYRYALERPNVVIFTATRTPERENKFHWIIQLTRNRYSFFALKAARIKIHDLEEAKRLTSIGVVRSTVWDQSLSARGFSNLDRANSHVQNVRKLIAGRIQVIYFTPTGLFETCNTAGVEIQDLEQVCPAEEVKAYIIMSKAGTPMATVKKWQAAAKAVKQDGTYERIAEKWIRYMKNETGFDAHFQDGAINLWKKTVLKN